MRTTIAAITLICLLAAPVRIVGLSTTILPAERDIAASPVEIGVGYDARGRERWRVTGNADTVWPDSVSDRQVDAYQRRIRGGVFTHNHPNGGACTFPSVDDVQAGAYYHLREMRAVSIDNGVIYVAIVYRPKWITYAQWNRAFDRHADLDYCARSAAAFSDLGIGFERISG